MASATNRIMDGLFTHNTQHKICSPCGACSYTFVIKSIDWCLCLIFCIQTRYEILEWGTVLEERFALTSLWDFLSSDLKCMHCIGGMVQVWYMVWKRRKIGGIILIVAILYYKKIEKKNQFPVGSEENFRTGRYISVRLTFLNLISFYSQQ